MGKSTFFPADGVVAEFNDGDDGSDCAENGDADKFYCKWDHVRSCLSEVRCGIIYGTGSYSGESTKLRIPASSGIGRK